MQDSNGPVGGQGYIDFDKPGAAPDRMAPVNRFGNENNGQTTIKQGSGTFQFGAQQSFGQRYNTDNIFNELTANLLSNSRMVPAGIVAVNRAQERGYSFVSS